MFEPQGPGIKGYGLDPNKRNAGGGATVVAAAQSGRVLSEADIAGVGQCLTGSRQYASDYATTSDHVLLRITLENQDLPMLIKSAATHEKFNNMEEAVDAKECTAIARILPSSIDYLAENNSWVSIDSYKFPAPKNFHSEVLSDVSSDDEW
jgi:hypothetical protein